MTTPVRRQLSLVLAFTVLTVRLAAGPWEPLFNGFDLTGWKVVNGTAPYVVADGAITGTTVAGSPNSFLVTEKPYGDFIFECEVRQAVGPSNSGIKYLVAPASAGEPVGFEFQLLDDERHPDAKQGRDGNRTTGSLYDLIPRAKMPGGAAIPPKAGAWQHARIVVTSGGPVEHWLNGIKVVEYERSSPDFAARVAVSKYAQLAGFGLAEQGPILLQDHGDVVRFRSIKIRKL